MPPDKSEVARIAINHPTFHCSSGQRKRKKTKQGKKTGCRPSQESKNTQEAMPSRPAFLVALVSITCFVSRSEGNSLPSDHVKTSLGVVKGTIDKKYQVVKFRGIRYTEAPVGDRRFAASRVYNEPWSGVYDATTFGAPCLQNPAGPVNEHPDPEAPRPQRGLSICKCLRAEFKK